MPSRDKKSRSYWLRKRVPQRYREIVDRKEVWRSLGTEDERIATVPRGKLPPTRI